MSRFYSLAAVGIAISSMAFAGQIEIGSSATAGVSAGGLDTAYFGGAPGVASVGNTAFSERSYSSVLFSTETISSSSLGGSTLPDSAGNQQLTDTNNGVTFGLISGDGTNNYWGGGSGFPGGSGSASPTYVASIVIPVGVFGVDKTWILMNDYWGVNGVNTGSVTFNFTGAGAPSPLVVNLINGTNIDSAMDCTAASTTFTSGGVNGGSTNCTTFAQSASGVSVAWSAHYVNTSSGTTPGSGTSGTVNLSDISFDLGAYSAYTLSSITITDGHAGYDGSRYALSAVSVDQVSTSQVSATPEPGTIAMLASGLGLLGFAGYKRRKMNS